MAPTSFKSNHPTVSKKTIEKICILLKDYNHTFGSVSREVNLSPTEVQTIFDEHVQVKRHPFSTAVCIDEIYFSKKENTDHNKYVCVFIDFKNGLILDILKSRHKGYLKSYFYKVRKEEDLSKVLYVSMDMNDTYREIAKQFFINARICSDRFHVMKNINDELDKIRLEVLNTFSENKKSDEYYLLKHKSKLLTKNSANVEMDDYTKNRHFGITYSSHQLLELILCINPKLKLAYNLKESYLGFLDIDPDTTTEDELRAILESTIDEFKYSGLKGFEKLANTFENWKEEIINSFSKYDGRMISNGPIEGRNKYIKIILKLANGYSNFKRFRNRAMYVLNKFEKYCEDVLDATNVRNKGDLRGQYKKK